MDEGWIADIVGKQSDIRLSKAVDIFMEKMLNLMDGVETLPDGLFHEIIMVFRELGTYTKIELAKKYGYKFMNELKRYCFDSYRSREIIRTMDHEIGELLHWETFYITDLSIARSKTPRGKLNAIELEIIKERDPIRRYRAEQRAKIDKKDMERKVDAIRRFEREVGF